MRNISREKKKYRREDEKIKRRNPSEKETRKKEGTKEKRNRKRKEEKKDPNYIFLNTQSKEEEAFRFSK